MSRQDGFLDCCLLNKSCVDNKFLKDVNKTYSKRFRANCYWGWIVVLLESQVQTLSQCSEFIWRHYLKKKHTNNFLLENWWWLIFNKTQKTQPAFQKCNFIKWNHPPFSPDLAPFDYNLFNMLRGWKFLFDECLNTRYTKFSI